MPKDNIERAILRGTGKGEGVEMEEMTFEGYGLDGVAFIVDTLSDNKNRTLAEVKRVFNRAGGTMATAGSVSWQFEQKGYIEIEAGNLDFDEVFMVAADAGAEDVVDEDGTFVVYTPRDAFGTVEQAIRDAGYKTELSELRWVAKNETEVSADKAAQNMRLMNDLEELDDVQSVASNLLITDEALAAFETA
jgi:YebC/PmpR family DNA-binding regulatory protein